MLSNAIGYASEGSLPRMKFEEFSKNATRLEALKHGISIMKSRKPSEPGSWFYQAAIHSVSEDDIADALQRDPDVAKVDQKRFWNKCPHYGQSSADFLIWHRAYIYYFERFLREASGDLTLSLPYWNYTNPVERGFPPDFADRGQENNENPLFDIRRELAFMNGLYELSERAVDVSKAYSETQFFGETEVSGFAGGVFDSDSDTKGLIESQPHDSLHFAIGGVIVDGQDNATVGRMSSVKTAAFDPIFWIHHANIDRLWGDWDCLANRSWGFVPQREWLESKPWYFNDIGSQVLNLSRLFYLDRRNIHVAYDTDVASCKPLTATTPLGLAGKGVSGMGPLSVPAGIKSFVFKEDLGHSNQERTVSPDIHSVSELQLKTVPGIGSSVKSNVLSAEGGLVRRLMLEIIGIRINGVPSVGYDVFINLPDGQTPSRSGNNFVGTLSLFGIGHLHKGHEDKVGINQRFDITKLLIGDVIKGGAVKLTIDPYDLLVARGSQPRLRREVNLIYSGFKVFVIEGSAAEIM
jgi:hypothetical protein